MAKVTIGEHRYIVMDYKEYKRIIYQPGRVTRIIMNRPRYRNALSHPHLAEIEDAFHRAAADPECRVIVLSGAGSCFSGGDDAIGLTPESAPMMAAGEETPEELMKKHGQEGVVWRYYQDEHFHLLHGMHGRLRDILKPTIAMVHGYCIFNAFNLARAMDIIFASEDALFLPVSHDQTVWEWGFRKALEIAYEHRFLTARECYELGFVNRIYPDFETLERETLAYAERVADNPMHIHRATKQSIYHVMDLLGFTTYQHEHSLRENAYGGGRGSPIRDVAEADKHRERFEGKGIARTPKALANLKAKLEGEGKEVPVNIEAAVARAAARDDRGAWDRALKQEWRDKAQAERADAAAKAYEEMRAGEKKRRRKASK